jgi:RNA polymerase sigma factor (sigma-70 family)
LEKAARMNALEEFERLALPHIDAAYNLAKWLVRQPADADDIVQDAYLRAFRSFDQFGGGDIRPWLLTIVRNVAYRWLSVRNRMGNVVSIEDALSAREGSGAAVAELASDEPSAEQVLLGRAECAMVREALARLPAAFRDVVVLREMEGLSYQEIAAITAVPIGTVMSRLNRARAQLKEHLTQMIDRENKDAL